MNKLKLVFIIFGSLIMSNCNSQEGGIMQNRKAVFAGQFYPGTKKELTATLKNLFSKALPKQSENVLAIIAPHAGYVFSGEVAATAFNQIDADKEYKRIFVIAPSHRTALNGASIYSKGNYITPLGIVKVDKDLAENLIRKNDCFEFFESAHKHEHSLEVELPFLQHIMKKDFSIVPIVVGTQSEKVIKKIASALKPFFNSENLFVISTDFSHFPSYKDAVAVDKKTVESIAKISPDELRKTLSDNAKEGIHGLATSLCGSSAVYTLLYMAMDEDDIKITPVQYKNSGDMDFGDSSRVVGYWAITVTRDKEKKEAEFTLTNEDMKELLKISSAAIVDYVKHGNTPSLKTDNFSESLLTKCGAFVSLYKNGRLRGCIGRFSEEESLCKIVQRMAIAAATQDSRFPQVGPEEIDKLDIEISVLTPLKRIESFDEIEIGKHGIYIRKGLKTGTYLPQVATGTGWSKEEFLRHCSHDKAGIGWDGWKTADLFIYEAVVFDEKEMKIKD